MLLTVAHVFRTSMLSGAVVLLVGCGVKQNTGRDDRAHNTHDMPASLELQGADSVELRGHQIRLTLVNRSSQPLSVSRIPMQMLPGRVPTSAPVRVRFADSSGVVISPAVVVDDGLFDEPTCLLLQPGGQVPVFITLRPEWFPRLHAGTYSVQVAYDYSADPCATEGSGWVVTSPTISLRFP